MITIEDENRVGTRDTDESHNIILLCLENI